jgi:hypothetical protein
MKIPIAYLLGGLFFSGAALAQNGAASGSVTDESSLPVAGAVVSFSRIPAGLRSPNGTSRALEPPFSTSAATGTDGKFAVTALPAGEYYVCAVGPLPQDLGSCEWGGAVTTIQVGSSSVLSGLSLGIRSGTLLSIYVSDPNGRIQQAPAAAQAPVHLNIGVGAISDTGFYKPASLVSIGAGGAEFIVAIPKTGRVRLLLDAPFPINDSSGGPVASRKPGLSISATGGSSFSVSLTVP